jgi:hypothetical protein
MGREPAAPCLWWGSIHTGRPRAVAAHTWDSPCTEEVTRDGALLDGSQSCLTVVNLASWPRRVQLLLISHGQRVRRPEMNRGDGGVGPGGERFHQPSHVDVACRVPQRCLACDVYGMHVMCVCNSVDRPRCQPGLRMKAYLCLHAAAQIFAGRQASARSTSSRGEPAAVWRSTELCMPCMHACERTSVSTPRHARASASSTTSVRRHTAAGTSSRPASHSVSLRGFQ